MIQTKCHTFRVCIYFRRSKKKKTLLLETVESFYFNQNSLLTTLPGCVFCFIESTANCVLGHKWTGKWQLTLYQP